MTRGELLFPAAIAAVVVVLLALGYYYYEYGWTTFAFPLGVGAVLCVLCAIEIAGVLRGRRAATAHAGSDIDSTDTEQERLSLPAVGWMFALVVFLYAFGFVFGAAIYLLMCLRLNGFSWTASAIVALGSMLVTWGLFIKILDILLPVWPLWMAS
jgi:hypothetical protein